MAVVLKISLQLHYLISFLILGNWHIYSALQLNIQGKQQFISCLPDSIIKVIGKNQAQLGWTPHTFFPNFNKITSRVVLHWCKLCLWFQDKHCKNRDPRNMLLCSNIWCFNMAYMLMTWNRPRHTNYLSCRVSCLQVKTSLNQMTAEEVLSVNQHLNNFIFDYIPKHIKIQLCNFHWLYKVTPSASTDVVLFISTMFAKLTLTS